jgi:DGQHR domain-containing protein
LAGFDVNAFVLRQKAHELYLFALSSDTLRRITYVTPRSHDDPNEIQRILRRKHAREIAEYVQQPTTLLPTAIVVSLSDSVEIHTTGDSRMRVVRFPAEEGKFAYVLDGQHRLRAFDEPGVPTIELPVVALYGADEATRAKVFADINSKQEPITDVHILELYYQIRDLAPEELGLVDIVHHLNFADDSPLKSRIKLRDDDRGTWVKNTILKRFVRRALVQTDIEFAPSARRAAILKEYLKAVEAMWPAAWGNNKDYSLSGSAGLEVMLGAFAAAKDRVDLNWGGQYTRDNFLKALQPLANASISVPMAGDQTLNIPLDWRTTNISILSRSQKGRETLITRIRQILLEADQPPQTDDGASLG